AREVAGYIIDEAMGHAAHVPPVVARELDGQPGAFMAFVEARSAMLQATDPEAEDPVRLFDEVVGDTDRHPGSFLVTSDGGVVPIEHGLILPTKNGSQGLMQSEFTVANMPLSAVARERLQRLVTVKTEITARLLALGIEQRAIDAMYQRVGRLLER